MKDLEKRIRDKNKNMRNEVEGENQSSIAERIVSPLVSLKKYICNKTEEKRKEADFQEECMDSFMRYLAVESISKIGSIEVRNFENGVEQTILFTELGPLIKTAREVHSDEENSIIETYEGFSQTEELDKIRYSKICKTKTFLMEDETSYNRYITYSGVTRNGAGKFEYVEEFQDESTPENGEVAQRFDMLERRFEKCLDRYSERFSRFNESEM